MESICVPATKNKVLYQQLSIRCSALIAVITAPQLKETLTPAKFDGAMFKHLTIANNTHTPVIGKACHWSTNNFHLFSVILVNLSMKH
jgi:hypothetical protein